MTEAQPHNETPTEVNLGILDGDVSHVDINRSISASERVILFGEQTRLPHFSEDRRLPRLHAADPLVLFFFRVLKKVPPYLRDALIDGPISITLVRGDTLFHFRDVRCHQAVHIGRRRRTIYLRNPAASGRREGLQSLVHRRGSDLRRLDATRLPVARRRAQRLRRESP